MNSDITEFPPPADSTAFESLCLELWKDIWRFPGAQKNGRRGQGQDGIDIFGQEDGNWVGVQCKQKDRLLWKIVKPEELEAEVKTARRFKPPLTRFILATTGPRDTELQECARKLTDAHKAEKLFSVEVWSWREIWSELYRRKSLFERIWPQYWPEIFQKRISALHQLPSLPTDFVGRESELDELERQLNGAIASHKHLGLHGMPGVGKSALATVLAYRLRERFPDAQLYLNLHGAEIGREPISPRAAMEKIIRSFDPAQDLRNFTDEELQTRYRSIIHNGGRILILLDNAGSAEQIRPLLSPPNCLLLITSRRALFIDELIDYKLECLPPSKSQALLVKIATRIKGYEEETAELCGHLPFALRVVAGRLRESSLVAPREIVDAFRRRQGKFSDVDAAFEASCQFLDPALCQQWYQLADFSGSFDLRAAKAVWDVAANCRRREVDGNGAISSLGDETALPALQALVNANLVEWNQVTNRFHVHDLARQFCREKICKTDAVTYATGIHKDLSPLLKRLEVALQIEDDAKLKFELEVILKEFPKLQAEVLANQNGADALHGILLRAFLNAGTAAQQELIHRAQQNLGKKQRSFDRHGEGKALFELACAYALANDNPQAINHAEKSLILLDEFKDPIAFKVREKLALWKTKTE